MPGSAQQRRLTRLGLVTVACAAALGILPLPAGASCVGPGLAVGADAATQAPDAPPPVLQPGATLRVNGTAFFIGCDDVLVHGSGGCSRARDRPAGTQRPDSDVPLRLVQGARDWELGRGDASDAADYYRVVWNVTLPDGVKAGRAELHAKTAVLEVIVRK